MKQFTNWTQKVALLQLQTLFKDYIQARTEFLTGDARSVCGALLSDFIKHENASLKR